jgi:hypothetical protein
MLRSGNLIPEVLPIVNKDSSSDPDASVTDLTVPGTYTAASVIPTPGSKPWNASESVIFTQYPFNADLLAYLVIGMVAFFIFFFIIYSTITSGGYAIYTSVSPILLFVGGLVSSLVMSFAAYRVRSVGVLALFLLIQIALFFWYFNLLFRIERVAMGGNRDGNGTGYLVIAIALMLGLMYIAWGRDRGAGLTMLVPIAWYMTVFYFWLYDGV